MSETLMMLAATTAKSHATSRLASEPDLPLDEVIRECMRGAFGSGMLTLARDEETAFKGAVAAAHGLVDETGREAIKAALDALRDLAAMTSGVPVDIERLVEEQERRKVDGLAIVPLSKLWDEVKAERVW